VTARDIYFAYPTKPDHLACRGFTLDVRSGTSCALCGQSGSGKSTIISLLQRFYDPQSGSILLDGCELTQLDLKWLRRQMALVGQEPVLFEGTVQANITDGSPGASFADMEEAAKLANAHDFIATVLPDGYDTNVGFGGARLSGGQKQRVAIARAMIRKPRLLLLDEATSALDAISQEIVQESLDSIAKRDDLSKIVIAHRLSTIRSADCIAVVSSGQVIECGKHDELIAMGGIYTHLGQH